MLHGKQKKIICVEEPLKCGAVCDESNSMHFTEFLHTQAFELLFITLQQVTKYGECHIET